MHIHSIVILECDIYNFTRNSIRSGWLKHYVVYLLIEPESTRNKWMKNKSKTYKQQQQQQKSLLPYRISFHFIGKSFFGCYCCVTMMMVIMIFSILFNLGSLGWALSTSFSIVVAPLLRCKCLRDGYCWCSLLFNFHPVVSLNWKMLTLFITHRESWMV